MVELHYFVTVSSRFVKINNKNQWLRTVTRTLLENDFSFLVATTFGLSLIVAVWSSFPGFLFAHFHEMF